MAQKAAKQHKDQSNIGKKRNRFEQAIKSKTALQAGALTSAISNPTEMMQLQRLVGNRQVAEMLARMTAQRDEMTPPGRGVSTEFGSYWIVPDGTDQSYMVPSQQIAETSFRKVEKTWDDIKNGTGNIQIAEKDVNGTQHANFRKQVLEYLGMLMSQPVGRALVMRLMNEETEQLTIRPSGTRKVAEATPEDDDVRNAFIKHDGTSSDGTDSIIEIDPDLKDDSVLVFNKEGDPIEAPVFLILGHELIHAENHMQGDGQLGIPAADPAYTDAEEEAAIAGTTVSENMLRAEHGYELRDGHDSADMR